MVNVQLASSTPPASTTLAGASTPSVTAVPVTVVSVSTALENLMHLIQTSATPVSAPSSNSLTLATALGNITVSLSQQLSAGEKQNLTQQLMNLLQTQRPLTLTLQAGSPPTQGTLLIPATTPTTTQNIQTPIPTQLLSAQPLSVGDDLPAIVLFVPPPSDAVIPAAGFLLNSAPTVEATLSIPSLPAPQVPAPAQPQTATVFAEASPPALPVVNALPPNPSAVSALPLTSVAAPTPTAPVATSLPTPVPVNAPATAQPTLIPAATSSPVAANAVYAASPNLINPLVNPINLQTAPQVLPQVATLLTPGNEVALHIDAVLPSAPLTPPTLAPNQILATVSGTGTGGEIILKAGDATLFVKAPVSAPVGTSFIVSIDPIKPAPLLTLPVQEPSNFPALPQAVTALMDANPQVLQQMMSSYVPQPTEALPGALLFFFSAFKQGNVRGWLGEEATDSLTKLGKSGIISSLSKELNSAGTPAQDAVVGEWRAYPIPLYAESKFQALTLYTHDDRDARKDKSGSAPATGKIRFLIDMRLSKLGALQVDGFVQPKKLDMILRSETILPEGLHHELRAAYIKALGAVGYAGTLNFQVGRQYWLAMQKPAQKGILT